MLAHLIYANTAAFNIPLALAPRAKQLLRAHLHTQHAQMYTHTGTHAVAGPGTAISPCNPALAITHQGQLPKPCFIGCLTDKTHAEPDSTCCISLGRSALEPPAMLQRNVSATAHVHCINTINLGSCHDNSLTQSSCPATHAR